MIVVSCLLDREAFPWPADWYHSRERDHFGDRTDDHFRLWYVDHALDGDDELQEDPTRLSATSASCIRRYVNSVPGWNQDKHPPTAFATPSRTVESGSLPGLPSCSVRNPCSPSPQRAPIAPRSRRENMYPCTLSPKYPRRSTCRSARMGFRRYGHFHRHHRTRHPAPARSSNASGGSPHQARTSSPCVSAQPDGDPATYARIDNLARVRIVVR